MSHEIEPISDPGLPDHVHRAADTNPVAEKKAERQVAILFLLSALGTILFIASYIFIPTTEFIFLPVMGTTNAHELFLGLGLALALLFMGLGAVHWAKTLMPDEEVIAERHEFRSEESDREDFVATVKERAAAAGLGRRSLIKRTLGLSGGLLAASPLLLLRDLGPLPKNQLQTTSWETGTRLVTDPGNRDPSTHRLSLSQNTDKIYRPWPAGSSSRYPQEGKDTAYRTEDRRLYAAQPSSRSLQVYRIYSLQSPELAHRIAL